VRAWHAQCSPGNKPAPLAAGSGAFVAPDQYDNVRALLRWLRFGEEVHNDLHIASRRTIKASSVLSCSWVANACACAPSSEQLSPSPVLRENPECKSARCGERRRGSIGCCLGSRFLHVTFRRPPFWRWAAVPLPPRSCRRYIRSHAAPRLERIGFLLASLRLCWRAFVEPPSTRVPPSYTRGAFAVPIFERRYDFGVPQAQLFRSNAYSR
jgi:hypothetical protein